MKRGLLLAVLLAFGCGGDGTRIEDHKIVERLDDSDEVTGDSRYVDSYWFRALETGSATANIDADEFDPVLTVYDEDGHRIVRDDDSGAGDDARATFRVNFGEFYEVVVSSYNELETGKYELSVSRELQFDSVITRDGKRRPAWKERKLGVDPKE
ncbi:MAG: hypothetical protein ACO1SV_13910 [Fimbriimonas sp.]